METIYAAEWIVAVITAALAAREAPEGEEVEPVGVYEDPAPEDATEIAVTFSYQTGNDVAPVGVPEIMATLDYTIQVSCPGRSDQPLLAIYDLVHEALLDRSNAGPTSSGGYVHGAIRLSPLKYTEDAGGVEYRHLGGNYRLFVS